MRNFIILLGIITTLSTPLYAGTCSFYWNDNSKSTYWHITAPVENSYLQNIAFKKSTEKLLSTKFLSAEACSKAEIAFFEKYITLPEITNLERSYLLLMRAQTHRQSREYKKSAERLIEIAKTGELPISAMGDLYYSLYQMAYGSGNFNLAAQAFSKYTTLSPVLFPWDQAALAEIMIKADRNDLALIKLDAAISALEQQNCPIEPNWQKLLHDLQENNTENIDKIKIAVLPVLYMPLNNPDMIPVERKNPKYPTKAAKKRIEGSAIIQIIISPEGKPLCAMSGGDRYGPMDFYEAAQTAAMQFRYKPNPDTDISKWIYGVKTRFTFQVTGIRR